MSAFINRWLIDRYIDQPNRQKTYDVFQKALGQSPVSVVGSMQSADTFDEQGNPVFGPATYEMRKEGGSGLLADIYNEENQARFANEMMQAPFGETIANAMMTQIQRGGQAERKLEMDWAREDNLFKQAQGIAYDSIVNTPQVAPTPRVGMGQRPNVSPGAGLSPQAGTTGQVGRSSVREPLKQPTGTAADYENYLAERLPIERMATHPAMKDTMKPILDRIDQKWGYGNGAPTAMQEWRLAQMLNGYEGQFEDWKKEMRQTIMKDAGTTYNMPVGPDAVKWMNDNGETAQYMDTPEDLQKRGFRILSPAQQDEVVQMNKALNLNSQLGKLLFGDDGKGGIYKDWDEQKSALVQRGEMSAKTLWNRITQDNPTITTYERLAQGTMSQVIRSMGEKGALAEGDVQRGEGLLISLFPADSKEVAIQMHKELQDLFVKGDRNRKIIWAAQRQGLEPTGTFDANGRPKFLDPKTNQILEWTEDE